MTKAPMIAIAALLTAGSALPALAGWNHVGTVQVSPDRYTDVQLGGFQGPVDRLRIHADGRADCDEIRVRYDNGVTREVYSGALYDGQDQTITFPGRSNLVSAVSFSCRAAHDDGAEIAVAADTPAFEAPARYDEPVLPAGEPMLIASRDFGVPGQRTLMLGDTAPRSVQAIALEPVGADARCSSIRATFDDGTTSLAMPNDGDDLYEGRLYKAYVGGRHHDLNSINLTCQAANSDHVKINVYAVG
ncbi:MAG: hypothetical protein V4559_01380 [Pseudomonadota bacterium]